MSRMAILAMIICAALLSSCSRNLSYFTENLYDNNNWSESELKKVQFYLSEDIRLVRVSRRGNSDISDGQIQLDERRKVDEVVIRKGTPGTLIFAATTDRFAVCFDEDPDYYLMFGPNPKAGGRYVLLAKDWRKRGGIISYGGAEYQTGAESAFAALMVDIKNARRSVKRSTTASGRTVRK